MENIPPAVPNTSDRRREVRYPVTDIAEITIIDGAAAHVVGRVLDVSRSGLCLALASPIKPPARITIRFRRPAIILGEVRYCKRVDTAFHVGVEILDVLLSPNRHVEEDELKLYLSGKGLTEAEFFYFRIHISECESCRIQLQERESV